MRRVAPLALLALTTMSTTSACLENPFGRPATFVDGSEFPEELRGSIAPIQGYVAGESVNYYFLEPAAPELGEVIVFVDGDGRELPACETGLRDDDGVLLDVDLDACQAPILGALPTDDGYSPYVKVLEARLPAGSAMNDLRSFAEVEAAGVELTASERVLDLSVIDPIANVVDPSDRLPRYLGWMDTLQLVYIAVADTVPTADGQVVPMEILVPQGREPGSAGDILQARAGDPEYSTLCTVVYFVTPGDYQPGDYTSAAEIPPEDRITPNPPELFHCAVP